MFLKIHGDILNQGVPPVSTTPAANFANGSAGAIDTSGKFATGVNDTCGLPPLSSTLPAKWQILGT
jgi:hypothetical protein